MQSERVHGDAREPLPFDDGSFDALLCVDSINHLYERTSLFRDWHRVLRPGGRLLFTNPTTVTGLIRRDEAMIRSGSRWVCTSSASGYSASRAPRCHTWAGDLSSHRWAGWADWRCCRYCRCHR